MRSRARIVGSLGQPLLFLLALGFGFGPVYQKAGGGNYIEFLAPGIIAMSILFTALFSGIEIIWDKQFGFLKETFVAPVSRLSIVFGRTLGGATVAMIQGLIVFGLSFLVGFRLQSSSSIPLMILIMFLIALLFTALGTAIASVLEDMQGFQLIMNFLVMPIFFFSGALFPLTGLPKVMTWVAAANPLAYGVDALRGSLAGISHFGMNLNILILGTSVLVLLSLASFLFSRMEL